MRITTSAVLAAAFVGTCVGPARAGEIVDAKIPFAFVVRGREFPAGRYEIATEDGVLVIRGLDHPSGGFIATLSAAGHDPAGTQPALVFTHDENEYELSEVWQSATEGFAVEQHSIARKDHRAGELIRPSVVLTNGLDAH